MRVAASTALATLAVALALTACAPATRVVMLPQPDHASVVEVTPRVFSPVTKASQVAPNDKTVRLTKPYQVVDEDRRDRISMAQWDPERVKSRYGALLAAQPPAAHSYLLYFEFNGTQLTPESADQLDQIIRQALARPGNEIIVTGYADSVGTQEANDQLSLQRAQVIRHAIIARGFNRARIYAVGRGARDPLVPMVGDQTAEQKNRRVEITVR